MQVEALKTFQGRMGLIRTGTVITVPDNYGRDLIAKGLAKAHTPRVLEPESNTDLGGPPQTKGEGEDADGDDEGNDDGGSEDDGQDPPPEDTTSKQSQDSGSTASSTEGRRTGGRAPQLSSQRVGRRSRKKT